MLANTTISELPDETSPHMLSDLTLSQLMRIIDEFNYNTEAEVHINENLPHQLPSITIHMNVEGEKVSMKIEGVVSSYNQYKVSRLTYPERSITCKSLRESFHQVAVLGESVGN